MTMKTVNAVSISNIIYLNQLYIDRSMETDFIFRLSGSECILLITLYHIASQRLGWTYIEGYGNSCY